MQVAEIQVPERNQELNERLLAHLHRGGAWGYFQAYHTSKTYTDKNGEEQRSKNSLWWPVGAAPTLAKLSQVIPQNDVYFGVNPSTVKRKNYERSTIGTIAAVNCFFAEFDAKDKAFGGSKESTLAHIDSLPYAPSVIIDSGGGFHCYWLLRDTVIVTDENRQDVINNQRAWVEFVGGDDGAKDISRILRIPGTLNHKPEYGNPRPVAYVRTAWARTFKYDDLCVDLAEIVEGYNTKTTPSGGAVAVVVNLDDEAVKDKAFNAKNGAEFQALWRGDMSSKGDDQNKSDAALCAHLAFYTKDAGQIDRLFRQSDLMRPKWDEIHYANGDTYGWHTINGAIEFVGSKGWTPGRNGTGPGASGAALFKSTVDENGEILPHPLAFLETNPLDYRPEDGGILDVWQIGYAEQWRYVMGYKIWRKWAETHWETDQVRGVPAQIQDLSDKLNKLARAESDRIDALNQGIRATNKANGTEAAEIFNAAKPYISATKRSAARVRSVEYMAENNQATSPDQWDRGNLLNLQNGVLDLDTLQTRERTQADLITYVLPYAYDPKAEAPKFEKFISEILVHEDSRKTDNELVELFQELWGYTLTTDTRQHAMAWLSGEGSNGKTLALNILQALLGPLALTVNFSELGKPGNYRMADIPGKRMILSTESERGATVTESKIREIASGDPMHTRPIYGSDFDFIPVAKIWWAMNDKPVIKDTSNAMWRRLKLIPFNQTFAENPNPKTGEKKRDTGLQEKLMGELPGILNWAIVGLERLRKNGKFTRSAAMEKAIENYKKESNPVAQWAGESIKKKIKAEGILQSVLYQHYSAWCHQNGRYSLSSTNFTTEMKRLGYVNTRKTAGSVFSVEWGEDDETTVDTAEDVDQDEKDRKILQELGI